MKIEFPGDSGVRIQHFHCRAQVQSLIWDPKPTYFMQQKNKEY